jgi:hypothetical protein
MWRSPRGGASRLRRHREVDEAGPDPIVGEGLAALDVGGLLGRWVGKRLLVMTWGRSMVTSDPTSAHRSVRRPAWPLQPQANSVPPARELTDTDPAAHWPRRQVDRPPSRRLQRRARRTPRVSAAGHDGPHRGRNSAEPWGQQRTGGTTNVEVSSGFATIHLDSEIPGLGFHTAEATGSNPAIAQEAGG